MYNNICTPPNHKLYGYKRPFNTAPWGREVGKTKKRYVFTSLIQRVKYKDICFGTENEK